MKNDDLIVNELKAFVNVRAYPCIAAKAAIKQNQLKTKVAADLSSPAQDEEILEFLYCFTESYRTGDPSATLYQSAAVIFRYPPINNEQMFDELMWDRLQALADLDAQCFGYDPRVEQDPESPRFSFSLMEEAYFIIGMHPKSSRPARRFSYPALIFNPHEQFERLRHLHKYEKMKNAVRKRDFKYAGTMNPMLKDHGESSEVYQYSGRKYDSQWRCPLKTNHGRT